MSAGVLMFVLFLTSSWRPTPAHEQSFPVVWRRLTKAELAMSATTGAKNHFEIFR